ncbi:hypothetical protein [Erythrobacter sp. YT30]|uniref:hypothetical protein n=1 Tax=Erythrobacter sp. YT30 TaxID=1735012 RepID=UPI00076DF1AE|nr:hypothetical protein [Erythrobacter sp. YT30]KWV91940.1 hypothetical protein AUC45_12295 [Erythrobacter sp. YT30]
MINRTIAAVLAITATPLSAEELNRDREALQVRGAVDAFFDALRSPDKTALAEAMIPDGVIFIHDRREPEEPNIRIVTAGEHLKAWETSPQGTDEYMYYSDVKVDGTMAHVWGPYVFLLNGERTHCGINSMSLAKFRSDHSTGGGWKVTNTSFTMTSLDECDALNAPNPISTIPTPEPE